MLSLRVSGSNGDTIDMTGAHTSKHMILLNFTRIHYITVIVSYGCYCYTD